MVEFIVHADDFGYSSEVNHCIDSCIKNGWVSETSLMVNMAGCDHAVELARKNGYAHRVGIHINLTEGVPLTEGIKRLPLFCTDGIFNKRFHVSQRSRFVLSKAESAAVFDELDAQLRKFTEYRGLMMRVDSHHHAHTDWSVYRILKPLAKRYGFESMRITANRHKVRVDVSLYKWLLNRDIRGNFKTREYFDGIVPGMLTVPCGTAEVMVHPLMWQGVLCDSRKPFSENIAKIMSVRNSFIQKVV